MAQLLVSRIREVMCRRRPEGPEVFGPEMGIDPNIVAQSIWTTLFRRNSTRMSGNECTYWRQDEVCWLPRTAVLPPGVDVDYGRVVRRSHRPAALACEAAGTGRCVVTTGRAKRHLVEGRSYPYSAVDFHS